MRRQCTERIKKISLQKKETAQMTISDQKKIDIVKEDADDDDDFGGMTIQQWTCLDGLSKSFKEDNT